MPVSESKLIRYNKQREREKERERERERNEHIT